MAQGENMFDSHIIIKSFESFRRLCINLLGSEFCKDFGYVGKLALSCHIYVLEEVKLLLEEIRRNISTYERALVERTYLEVSPALYAHPGQDTVRR